MVADASGAPLSAYRLLIAAFGLYRRYPLLFLILAAGVVVPYELIVLAITGSGPFAQSSLDLGTSFFLSLTDLALVGPLVSALHVHAVGEVQEGRDPHLVAVARHGLTVLPVVAAASIVSWLGIFLGLLLFIVPGVILTLRWAVVAQAAAIEHEGWLPALRRSDQLTDGHYKHVLVFVIYVALILAVPSYLIGLGVGHESTSAASFLAGVIVQVVVASFSALATALLYYDLRARLGMRVAQAATEAGPSPALSEVGPSLEQSSFDPRDYSPQERPNGWYVNPDSPNRMRYWGGGDSPGWGGSIRTPRKIRSAWLGTDQDE